MLGVWYAIKPENLIINNGVVYFSVSPVLLIVSSGLCYVLIRVIQTILKPSDKYSRRVSVLFINGLHKVSCNCIVDTGCSVGDAFGDFRVAIVGFNVAKELFGEKETLSLIKLAPDDNISKKFRLIPYNTLNSSGVLPAVRVEGAFVFGKELKNVLVCVSDKNFCDDFEGIISPLFFDEGDACV